MRKRRATVVWWLALYKMSHGCQHVYDDGRVCGWREDPCGLTFDHTDGKSMRLPDIRSIQRALEEIRRHRCVVLCANHHNMKTKAERQNGIQIWHEEFLARYLDSGVTHVGSHATDRQRFVDLQSGDVVRHLEDAARAYRQA